MRGKLLAMFIFTLAILFILSYPVFCETQGSTSGQLSDSQQAQKDSQYGKSPSSKEIQDMMTKMNTGMSKMMADMYNALLDLLANKDTAVKLAVFTKNYYDELVKQGFTKEEALQIVTKGGMLPSLMQK